MSKVSGVLEESVHKNSGCLENRGSHDGWIDGPVIDQPTEARCVFFFGGIWELLPECSECLAGKISDTIRNFIRRVDNRRQKVFAPPL